MNRQRISALLIATILTGTSAATSQSNVPQGIDPPARVGRVSDLVGPVSLKPIDMPDWVAATVNYPLTTGDALWASDDARAAAHVGSSAVHLGALTSVVFDTIDDHLIRVHIAQGTALFRVRFINRDDHYQVSTPSGVVNLRSEGSYRFDVTPDGQRSTVTVRDGDADMTIGGQVYFAQAGQSTTITSNNRPPVATGPLVPSDAWEQWADSLNSTEDTVMASRYVSRDMVGYEELDRYGTWQSDATYGHVWQPRNIPVGWSPYRTGHWESIRPWGWTWIAEEPWGFATSHYGRWTQMRGQWCWLPGEMRSVPVYAPAVVTFASNPVWGTSLALGPMGGVGWLPLGPGEPYFPSYYASPLYLRNVNFNYFNVIGYNFSLFNVSQYRYVNYLIPGAVIIVSQPVFTGGLPIRRSAATVHPGDLTGTRTYSTPWNGSGPIAPNRNPRSRNQDGGAAQPSRSPTTGGAMRPAAQGTSASAPSRRTTPSSPPSALARGQQQNGSAQGSSVGGSSTMRARSASPAGAVSRNASASRPPQPPPASPPGYGNYYPQPNYTPSQGYPQSGDPRGPTRQRSYGPVTQGTVILAPGTVYQGPIRRPQPPQPQTQSGQTQTQSGPPHSNPPQTGTGRGPGRARPVVGGGDGSVAGSVSGAGGH